jgi:hypothetical protein
LSSSSLKKQTNLKQLDRKDVVAFRDSLRKSETADPLHRWIGTYNLYRVHLIRFFKWLYYPDRGSFSSVLYRTHSGILFEKMFPC